MGLRHFFYDFQEQASSSEERTKKTTTTTWEPFVEGRVDKVSLSLLRGLNERESKGGKGGTGQVE